jgi:hypothetical protein
MVMSCTAVLCLLATGCYSWVRVPPQELAKLDRGDPPPIPESARQTRTDYWAHHEDTEQPPPPVHRLMPEVVQTDDGGTFDVDTAVAIRIFRGSQHADFKRPVSCVVTPEELSLAQGHERPIVLKSEDVSATDVLVYRRALSRSLWTFGFVTAAILTYVVGVRLLENIDRPSRS